MKRYLQTYTLEVTVKGPVFIGSGKALSKKEYLFQTDPGTQKQYIQVIDIEKMYRYLSRKGLNQKFEDFILNDRRDLYKWLRDNRIQEKELNSLLRYRLPYGDTPLERGTKVDIMECVKDPYGHPYVPGSSIKGMLRTVLLSWYYDQDQEAFEKEKRDIRNAAQESVKGRNTFLDREVKVFEQKSLNTLNRDEKRLGSAVNDMLSGLIVGDSAPLRMEDIVLCQKVDRHTDGTSNTLNLLRECIRPGTKIYVPLTIDTSVNTAGRALGEEILKEAIEHYIDVYYECFLAAFKGMPRLTGDHVVLGGGAGYASKTITYPVFGKEEGIRVAQDVFAATLSGKIASQHKHYKDNHLGASPHTVKCTKYQGRICLMGICSVKFLPGTTSHSE